MGMVRLFTNQQVRDYVENYLVAHHKVYFQELPLGVATGIELMARTYRRSQSLYHLNRALDMFALGFKTGEDK